MGGRAGEREGRTECQSQKAPVCVRLLAHAPRPVPGPQAQTSGPQPFKLFHADATRHRPNDLAR